MKRILLGLALLGLSSPAWSLCILLVCSSCTVSTSGVAFGAHNPLSPTNHDSAGSITVTCGGVLLLQTYSIAIGRSGHNNSFSPRQMGSGSDRLNYNLYTANDRTTIWGDGSGGTAVVPGSLTILSIGGTDKVHTVYGRIPGSQTAVVPGSYSDSVMVTVTYD